jgi:hypothetical protein
VIKLTHELSNRINRRDLKSYADQVAAIKISPKKYAYLSANKEVDGEINQIKVAAQIDYRYRVNGSKDINMVIGAYAKNSKMNLRKLVAPSKEHIQTYIKQGLDLQKAYSKRKQR